LKKAGSKEGIMKRLFFLFLVASIMLHAAGYDSTLLKAHAKLLPKIILLDKSLDKKLVNGKIKILVVAGSKDMGSAAEFKNLIELFYQGKLMQFPLEVEIADGNGLEVSKSASAVYLLTLPSEQIQKALKVAKKEGAIVFSYNLEDLSKGALVSVRVEAKTVIYFNRSSWDSDAIQLRPEFFKVARAYE